MAIAIIKDIDAKLFELNGIKYVKNFMAVVSGNNVTVSNAYDSRFTLVSAAYTEYVVNGLGYANANELASALASILFVKDELEMTAPGESTNNTVTAIFSNINGTWINEPSVPGTGNIVLDISNAVNGGVCAVYYSGAVITKTIFTGGTIVFLSGANVLNELCLVLIMYDKGSNGFTANIQAGATGDIPTPPAGDVTPPAQMEITSAIGDTPDGQPPAQMEITNVV